MPLLTLTRLVVPLRPVRAPAPMAVPFTLKVPVMLTSPVTPRPLSVTRIRSVKVAPSVRLMVPKVRAAVAGAKARSSLAWMPKP